MVSNDDFEEVTGNSKPSGEGYKDAAETLLGTNEKSSSMTSRERVDDALEEVGAEVLSKYGVPKDLGKRAIKDNGGKFSPTNFGINKITKNVSRNKLAKGVDKIDAAKNKVNNGKESSINRLNSKNQYKNTTNDSKKMQKDSDGKAEKSTGLKQGDNASKDDSKKIKKNGITEQINNAKSKASQEAKGAAEMAIKVAVKIAAKKVLIMAAPYIAGFVLAVVLVIFVIEIILGPLMEVWGNIDEAITGVANFSEKLDNFYNGFGFQDSKEAFYDEIDSLCERYGCSNDGSGLDVPLLLSTLFYTEGMGYDTDYSTIEDEDASDGSLIDGGSSSSMFSVIREYAKQKFDESNETVDEDGIPYNAGKIYRIRKLARNQFNTNAFGVATRQGNEKTVSIHDFVEMVNNSLSEDLKNLFSDIISFFAHLPIMVVETFIGWLVGSDYTDTFFYNEILRADDAIAAVKQLFADFFYGLKDIVSINWLKNEVTYREYAYDEENYKNYLMDYYFEYMPEFRSMLGDLKGDKRERKKLIIYNEIIENKNLFKDIFLQYQSSSSEEYTNSCVGAIDNSLVSELNLPVDIASEQTVSFDSAYSYGLVDGKNHNGVDLNETTVGVKLGSKVYAVSNGKIESIKDIKCSNNKSCGKSVKVSHDVIIDNEEYKFYTIYSNVSVKSGLKKGSTLSKGSEIGTIYNSKDNTEGLHFTFMDANSDSSGTVIDPTNLFIACNTGSGKFEGSTNEEAVWNYLLGLGYSKNATAGIMGNMSVESASTFDGRIVQGDYDSALTYSIDYTKKVDNGSISKTTFSKNGPNGGGYGIVQWTYYTLKEGLYDYAKNEKKTSIGDTAMQIDYLNKILQSNYSDLYNDLTNSNVTISSATSSFMLKFERPADQSSTAQNNRISRSKEIYNRYSTN